MKAVTLIMTLSIASIFTASAGTYKLEGKIGDKYSIVIELDEFERGLFSGKNTYLSTLRNSGDVECSWLQITPDNDSPYSEWTVRDCESAWAETWYSIRFSDRKHLTARMKNAKGKYYDVVATVKEESSDSAPLNVYFKQHIGDTASDFDMFNEPKIRMRLRDLLGLNYEKLKDIYQVQDPIEYRHGMFWGSGFMAHQCCNPAAVWAYDANNNTFYIWIRDASEEYWWSESGRIPYEFQELVNETF